MSSQLMILEYLQKSIAVIPTKYISLPPKKSIIVALFCENKLAFGTHSQV